MVDDKHLLCRSDSIEENSFCESVNFPLCLCVCDPIVYWEDTYTYTLCNIIINVELLGKLEMAKANDASPKSIMNLAIRMWHTQTCTQAQIRLVWFCRLTWFSLCTIENYRLPRHHITHSLIPFIGQKKL